MGSLPTLKAREVASRLEDLGFGKFVSAVRTSSIGIRTVEERRFRLTRVATFPRGCCARLRRTSVSRSSNFWVELRGGRTTGSSGRGLSLRATILLG